MHIESRPSKQDSKNYDFFVACDNTKGGLQEAINELREVSEFLTIMSRSVDKAVGNTGTI